MLQFMGHKELGTTKQLNNNKISHNSILNEIKESIVYYLSLFYNIYPPIYYNMSNVSSLRYTSLFFH